MKLLRNQQILYLWIDESLTSKGVSLGSMSKANALAIGRERSMDVFLIGDNPVTCFIGDPTTVFAAGESIAKTGFDPSRKCKTVKISSGIGLLDFERKIIQVRDYLARGNRCKVECGSDEIVDDFKYHVTDIAKVEQVHTSLLLYPL